MESQKKTQKSSLRQKKFKHKKSDAHLTAVEIHEQSKEKQIEKVLKMHWSKSSLLLKVFRTVCRIVKSQSPFVDLPNEIDL